MKTLKTFRVSFTYDLGVCLNVEARNEQEAEDIVLESLSLNGIGEDNKFDVVHRDYSITGIEK